MCVGVCVMCDRRHHTSALVALAPLPEYVYVCVYVCLYVCVCVCVCLRVCVCVCVCVCVWVCV